MAGEFSVKLPPGNWDVFAYHDGFAPTCTVAFIEPGKVTAGQNKMDGSHDPAGSLYKPMVISVMGWTTCRPLARHQRSKVVLREGRRMPGPPNDSAEAISACKSRLLSAVA